MASVPQTEDATSLEPGDTRLVKLTGGESHRYRVASTAGQLLRVTVEQLGVDVTLSLRAPSGEEPVVMDALTKTVGGEELSWESPAGGQFILEIRATAKEAKGGSYRIALKKLGPAGAQDKERILAERLFMEGRQDQALGDRAALERSAQKFEEAANKWRRAGLPKWEGLALSSAGTVNTLLGRFDAARKLYESALKLRHEAGDALGESDTLNGLGGLLARLGRFAEARGHLERAQALARAGGDRSGEGDILNNLAIIYANTNQVEQARQTFNSVLGIRRELHDRRGEGRTLGNIGLTYSALQQQAAAIEFFEAAAAIGREINDERVMADALGNLGMARLALSQYEKARDNFEQSLTLNRRLGNKLGERAALSNLGAVFSSLGQYGAARENYERALEIIRAIGDRKGEGGLRTNLGVVYWHLGDYGRALAEQNQARAIASEFEDRLLDARALNNMGLVYWEIGELERALELLEQSRAVRREFGDKLGEGSVLANLGNVRFDMGDADAARRYYEQALAIMREIGNRNYEGTAISNIGEVYHRQRQFAKALENFGDALRISREVKDRRGEGQALSNMGAVRLEMGEYEAAGDSYTQALAIARDTQDAGAEASALYGLSLVEMKRGELAAARAHAGAACDLVEEVRTRIGTPESRANYFATAQRFYEHYIEVLMRLHARSPRAGLDSEAFRVSERKRARSLLEVLNEAGIKAGRVDPALSHRESELRELLSAKAQRRVELLSGKRDEEALAAVSKELTALLRELGQVRADIRKSSPDYAALTHPNPASLREVQQQLDSDTLLLEYSLGDETSYVWAVTRDSKAVFRLPGRAAVEAAAEQFFKLVTARYKAPFETDAMRAARVAKADESYPRAAGNLGRMLLGPVVPHLADKRILIVADGALQFVPFAALASPGPRGAGRRGRGGAAPLIVDHEIVSLPSASALAILRKNPAGGELAAGGVAVFADPVFDKEDPRVGAGRGGVAAADPPQCVAEADVGRRLRVRSLGLEGEKVELPRLPCTRREAEAIAAVAPPGSLQATDFRASRAEILKLDLKKYRIVHVATHGLLDATNPELSSLVLSLVDEQGNPQNGFLRLHDIYDLDLPVEMVVLSSCQSALGKEVKGEGLLGLTRGFMHAGARRLVVSLWEVNDAGASELMSHFYRGMLKEGRRPPAALREAQIKMWREGRWKQPYYWAGFILQGEYR